MIQLIRGLPDPFWYILFLIGVAGLVSVGYCLWRLGRAIALQLTSLCRKNRDNA